MPDHRKLLLISVLVLTALLFIEYFFLHDQYFFLPDVPDFISGQPISIAGLYLIVCFFVVYHLVFRRILKQNPELSFWYLVIFGVLITFFSEVIFQFYRQFTFTEISNAERMRYFFTGVLGLTIASGIIAVSTALELKFKNRWLNYLFNVAFLLILFFLLPYFKEFFSN